MKRAGVRGGPGAGAERANAAPERGEDADPWMGPNRATDGPLNTSPRPIGNSRPGIVPMPEPQEQDAGALTAPEETGPAVGSGSGRRPAAPRASRGPFGARCPEGGSEPRATAKTRTGCTTRPRLSPRTRTATGPDGRRNAARDGRQGHDAPHRLQPGQRQEAAIPVSRRRAAGGPPPAAHIYPSGERQ